MIKHELRIDDLLFSYSEYSGFGIIAVHRGEQMIELIKTKELDYDGIMRKFSELEKEINAI